MGILPGRDCILVPDQAVFTLYRESASPLVLQHIPGAGDRLFLHSMEGRRPLLALELVCPGTIALLVHYILLADILIFCLLNEVVAAQQTR